MPWFNLAIFSRYLLLGISLTTAAQAQESTVLVQNTIDPKKATEEADSKAAATAKARGELDQTSESPDDAVWGAALWLYDQLKGQQQGVNRSAVQNVRADIRFLSLYNVPLEATRLDPDTGEEIKYSPLDEMIKVLIWTINQTNLINPPAGIIQVTPTLYAIPLTGPGWGNTSWETLAATDPYFKVEWLQSKNIGYLVTATQTSHPIMRADHFIKNSTLAPHYYNLLFGVDQVGTREEFHKRLGIQEELLKATLRIKAGVRASGLTVTKSNRRLERREGVFDLWTSYDVLNNKGRRNALRQLGQIPGEIHALQYDGQEHIFELGWGGFGGFLNNKEGKRIPEVPITIAPGETNFADRRVRAGRSCMGCHVKMVNPFNSDQHKLLKKQAIELSAADPAVGIVLRAAYDEERIQEYIGLDQDVYEKAVKRLVGVSGPEISAMFVRAWTVYDEERVSIDVAAREMGLSTDQAIAVLTPAIDPNLLMLLSREDNGQPLTIARDTWEDVFDDAMLLKGKPQLPPPEKEQIPDDAKEEIPEGQPSTRKAPSVKDEIKEEQASAKKAPPLEDEIEERVSSKTTILLQIPLVKGSVQKHLVTLKANAKFSVEKYSSDHNEFMELLKPKVIESSDSTYVMEYPVNITIPNDTSEIPTYVSMKILSEEQWVRIPIKIGSR